MLDDLELKVPNDEIMRKFSLKNLSYNYRIINSKEAIRSSLTYFNSQNKIIVKHKNENIDRALVNFISN